MTLIIFAPKGSVEFLQNSLIDVPIAVTSTHTPRACPHIPNARSPTPTCAYSQICGLLVFDNKRKY